MRNSLQIALMAASLSAISFPLHPLYARSAPVQPRGRTDNAPAITVILEGNRRVFVNDPPQASSGLRPPRTLAPDIDKAIEQAATRHNLDAELVRSVAKVESNFNPRAVSPKGAMGVMQLMPATAHRLGVEDPFDVDQNVDAGARYLRDLLAGYGGDLDLTLAAYNAGEAAVARSRGVPNYTETRDYVRRVGLLYHGKSASAGHAMGRGFTASNTAAPIRVERDARGMLHISNTD